ncbi:transcriptional regulator [Limoniibacter endophyticus]|uniref:Transcriptional regulator n=1 Tax=Limoniibacter endophyticus TaxID=1565040 RepID=A0A8J3DF37_9HYPH|nr:transcriptional regulator [Limoniibacter endophyticus]
MERTNKPDTTDCRPLSEALSKIGDKWTILIAIELEDGPKRFSALQRSVEGVSQRMLALTLRRLERDGLVERTVYPTKPPSVEYALSDLGREMTVPVKALGTWVAENLIRIERARLKFDTALD